MSHIHPDRRHKRRIRLGIVILGAVFGVTSAAGIAAAVWSISSNPGSQGSAAAAALSAPSLPTATATGSGAITIGWSLPGSQLAGASYQVTRTTGPGSPTVVCTVTAPAASCQDTGLQAATSYSYGIAAVLSTWSSAVITASTTTSTPTLVVTLSAGPYTAGTAASVVNVVAKVGGVVDPTYVGLRTLTWSGLGTSGAGNVASYPTTSATFVAGTATLNSAFTAYSAGAQTLAVVEAANSSVSGGVALTVVPANASRVSFTSSPATGSATTSATIGPITVQQRDAYGNPVNVGIGTAVTLSSNSSGTAKFATTSGGTAVTTVTIPIASSSVSFYYADNKSGSPVISAVVSGLTTGTQSETITAASGNKLVFTSGSISSSAVGTATLGPLTVQEQDTFGNPVTAGAGGVSLTLSSNSTGTKEFSPSSGGSSATTATIPNGSSSVSFYYGDTKAGTPTITVAGTGLISATQTETITAGAASQLAITSSAVSGSAGSTAALGPITVAQQDAYGNAVNATSGGLSVTLSSNSSGTAVFAASSGGTSTTAVTIPASASSVTFYYGDTKAGSPVITAFHSGLTSTTQTETITSASASKLAFTSAALNTTATGTATMGALTVQQQDAYGNPVNATSSLTVNLASNSSGTKEFSATSGGTSTTSVTIANGSSSVSFYYGDTRAGTPTITASRSGLTSATQVETITAAAASKLVFTTSPNSGSHGGTASIGPFTVQQQDQWGNPVSASTGGASVTLSATGNGFFATTSGSTTHVSAVTIASGSSSVSFYYGDSSKEAVTITAAASGLTSATANVTTN